MHREDFDAKAVTFSLDSSRGDAAELSASEVAEKLSRFKVELVQMLNPQSAEFRASGVNRLDDDDANELWNQIQGALHVKPAAFEPDQRLSVLAAITEAITGYTVKGGFVPGKLAAMVKKINQI